MNRAYSNKDSSAKKVSDEQLAEITSLKRIRNEMKQAIDQVSQMQIQEHRSIIAFYMTQKAKIDDENEKTKKEIHRCTDRIFDLREHLEKLAHDIANTGDQENDVQVLVDIDKEDPMWTLNNRPRELQQLLESLNAVKESIV
jgi:prefoldin subunit 5